ncbi:hypothetical protein SLEP1_g22706 [Rubroshorea leprosula]|nr:hypothetical protein SLEP1_g22706 [Rubroshorea leprosula]
MEDKEEAGSNHVFLSYLMKGYLSCILCLRLVAVATMVSCALASLFLGFYPVLFGPFHFMFSYVFCLTWFEELLFQYFGL